MISRCLITEVFYLDVGIQRWSISGERLEVIVMALPEVSFAIHVNSGPGLPSVLLCALGEVSGKRVLILDPDSIQVAEMCQFIE